LLFLRDTGPTEVGAFGISSPSDLLLVEDLVLLQQDCTEVTVRFDDGSVADHFDRQVDLGRTPEQVGRIWIHTHPGSCPLPSRTDETTFSRCFGSSDWAILFILARGGKSYARIRFTAGPGGEMELAVGIACEGPFPAADTATWVRGYQECVHSNVMCWDDWELRPHALDDEAILSTKLADRTVDGNRDVQSFWPPEIDHAWIV
jgi:hypothetical protein